MKLVLLLYQASSVRLILCTIMFLLQEMASGGEDFSQFDLSKEVWFPF